MSGYLTLDATKVIIKRFYSIKNRKPIITAKNTRQQFLDFFVKDNSYNFFKSSPVVPLHDATIPFVNAGMHQFKGIFLNQQSPTYAKVANTQKCIRIGGKHNDLEAVGQDGYHHTFFEMLGNWTFNNCSKEEVCRLAWTLLTKVYQISPKHLYVTYFGGNDKLKLPPDEECRDVWRNLGLPADRILPFGMEENFWEMGATGPCGPCTEIHFDHLGGPNRSAFVNKGLHELIELWNIVFIEYQRDAAGQIKSLPAKHVDTGMGFERLVAVLEKKISNYDTDVFKYLFDAINKNSPNTPKYKSLFGENDWNYLHCNYRILADHARMITVSLADGVIPEQNQKLRRILRRAFFISENTFKVDKGLLKELSNYIIENLGAVYPELETNSKQLHQMIDYEEDVYHHIRKSACKEWSKLSKESPMLNNLDILEMPGLVQAYKEITNKNVKHITPEFAYKLYDTYGMEEAAISKLCTALDIKFNPQDFRSEMTKMKRKSKNATFYSDLNALSLLLKDAKTDDSEKYKYVRKSKDAYEFPSLETKVLKIVANNESVDSIGANEECALVLDKSNLYFEAGGQVNDEGVIEFPFGSFEVNSLKPINNCILHVGVLKSSSERLTVNAKGIIRCYPEQKLNVMRNHTATHLLNAVLKELKGATCQKSSKVTNKFLNFDVGIFTSGKLSAADISDIENRIREIVKARLKVKFTLVNSSELLSLDGITLVPGEIYPEDNIRIVEIAANDGSIISREPCCGTHVHNTEDIGDFCFTSSKSLGRSTLSLHAITGEHATSALKNGKALLEAINKIEQICKNSNANNDIQSIESNVANMKDLIKQQSEDDVIPLLVKLQATEKLDAITRKIKEIAKSNLRNFIADEMRNVLENNLKVSDNNNKFAVHFMRSHLVSEQVPLQKATANAPVPLMLIALNADTVKATCCVPLSCANQNFNAEKWMQAVADVFNANIQRGKGGDVVCNLKGAKVSTNEFNVLLDKTLKVAEEFAKKNL